MEQELQGLQEYQRCQQQRADRKKSTVFIQRFYRRCAQLRRLQGLLYLLCFDRRLTTLHLYTFVRQAYISAQFSAEQRCRRALNVLLDKVKPQLRAVRHHHRIQMSVPYEMMKWRISLYDDFQESQKALEKIYTFRQQHQREHLRDTLRFMHRRTEFMLHQLSSGAHNDIEFLARFPADSYTFNKYRCNMASLICNLNRSGKHIARHMAGKIVAAWRAAVPRKHLIGVCAQRCALRGYSHMLYRWALHCKTKTVRQRYWMQRWIQYTLLNAEECQQEYFVSRYRRRSLLRYNFQKWKKCVALDIMISTAQRLKLYYGFYQMRDSWAGSSNRLLSYCVFFCALFNANTRSIATMIKILKHWRATTRRKSYFHKFIQVLRARQLCAGGKLALHAWRYLVQAKKVFKVNELSPQQMQMIAAEVEKQMFAGDELNKDCDMCQQCSNTKLAFSGHSSTNGVLCPLLLQYGLMVAQQDAKQDTLYSAKVLLQESAGSGFVPLIFRSVVTLLKTRKGHLRRHGVPNRATGPYHGGYNVSRAPGYEIERQTFIQRLKKTEKILIIRYIGAATQVETEVMRAALPDQVYQQLLQNRREDIITLINKKYPTLGTFTSNTNCQFALPHRIADSSTPSSLRAGNIRLNSCAHLVNQYIGKINGDLQLEPSCRMWLSLLSYYEQYGTNVIQWPPKMTDKTTQLAVVNLHYRMREKLDKRFAVAHNLDDWVTAVIIILYQREIQYLREARTAFINSVLQKQIWRPRDNVGRVSAGNNVEQATPGADECYINHEMVAAATASTERLKDAINRAIQLRCPVPPVTSGGPGLLLFQLSSSPDATHTCKTGNHVASAGAPRVEKATVAAASQDPAVIQVLHAAEMDKPSQPAAVSTGVQPCPKQPSQQPQRGPGKDERATVVGLSKRNTTLLGAVRQQVFAGGERETPPPAPARGKARRTAGGGERGPAGGITPRQPPAPDAAGSQRGAAEGAVGKHRRCPQQRSSGDGAVGGGCAQGPAQPRGSAAHGAAAGGRAGGALQREGAAAGDGAVRGAADGPGRLRCGRPPVDGPGAPAPQPHGRAAGAPERSEQAFWRQREAIKRYLGIMSGTSGNPVRGGADDAAIERIIRSQRTNVARLKSMQSTRTYEDAAFRVLLYQLLDEGEQMRVAPENGSSRRAPSDQKVEFTYYRALRRPSPNEIALLNKHKFDKQVGSVAAGCSFLQQLSTRRYEYDRWHSILQRSQSMPLLRTCTMLAWVDKIRPQSVQVVKAAASRCENELRQPGKQECPNSEPSPRFGQAEDEYNKIQPEKPLSQNYVPISRNLFSFESRKRPNASTARSLYLSGGSSESEALNDASHGKSKLTSLDELFASKWSLSLDQLVEMRKSELEKALQDDTQINEPSKHVYYFRNQQNKLSAEMTAEDLAAADGIRMQLQRMNPSTCAQPPSQSSSPESHHTPRRGDEDQRLVFSRQLYEAQMAERQQRFRAKIEGLYKEKRLIYERFPMASMGGERVYGPHNAGATRTLYRITARDGPRGPKVVRRVLNPVPARSFAGHERIVQVLRRKERVMDAERQSIELIRRDGGLQ